MEGSDGNVAEVIELLGNAARAVRELGAENQRLLKEVTDLTMRLDGMEEDWAMHSCHAEDYEDMLELLLNFRSGIADEDELLDGTVGRR